LASDRLADAEYVSLINPEKCQLIIVIRSAMVTNPTLTSTWYPLGNAFFDVADGEGEGKYQAP
jgi:hypothetical protein